jgi:hypothetical protein
MRRRVIQLEQGRVIRDEAAVSTWRRVHARVRRPHARRRRAGWAGSRTSLGSPPVSARPVARRAAVDALAGAWLLKNFGKSERGKQVIAFAHKQVPSFAAMATVLVTMLVLGVFIPVVQATTGAANDIRGKLLLDVYLKPSATPSDATRVHDLIQGRIPNVKSVTYISKQQAYQQQVKRNPEAYRLLGSNPLPDTLRIVPATRARSSRSRPRSSPRARVARARRSTPPSTRSRTAATRPRRSSRPRAW